MRKRIQRKFLNKVPRKSHQNTCSQVDLVSLLKKKERIPETKAIKEKYHLSVVKEKIIMIVAVMRNQIKESHGILNPVEKSLLLKVTPCKSKTKIEKG